MIVFSAQSLRLGFWSSFSTSACKLKLFLLVITKLQTKEPDVSTNETTTTTNTTGPTNSSYRFKKEAVLHRW